MSNAPRRTPYCRRSHRGISEAPCRLMKQRYIRRCCSAHRNHTDSEKPDGRRFHLSVNCIAPFSAFRCRQRCHGTVGQRLCGILLSSFHRLNDNRLCSVPPNVEPRRLVHQLVLSYRLSFVLGQYAQCCLLAPRIVQSRNELLLFRYDWKFGEQ